MIDAVRKTIWWIILNVNSTDTKVSRSGLVSKTQYDSDKKQLQENIEDADKKDSWFK